MTSVYLLIWFLPPPPPIKLRGWVSKALVLLKRLYSVFSRLAGSRCSILSWAGLLHGNWSPWYAWMYADYDYLCCETYLSDVNTDYELWSYEQCVNPWHQHAYSQFYSLDISSGSDMENFFNNQEILLLVIISLILMTLIFNSGGIL